MLADTDNRLCHNSLRLDKVCGGSSLCDLLDQSYRVLVLVGGIGICEVEKEENAGELEWAVGFSQS